MVQRRRVWNGAAGLALETRLVPSHLLIDAEGRIVRRFVGFHGMDDLVPALDTLLAPKLASAPAPRPRDA